MSFPAFCVSKFHLNVSFSTFLSLSAHSSQEYTYLCKMGVVPVCLEKQHSDTTPLLILEKMHPLEKFKFCPKCGSAHFDEHNGKSKHCRNCGFTYYFNPSAATVAVILNNRNELLVCRRGKDPGKGTLDLPGGFIDMYENGEEGVTREVLEETSLKVTHAEYLFSIPNLYEYSGFTVHTLDLFFRCTVPDSTHLMAEDDVAETFWMPLTEIRPEDFGLQSIRKGVHRILELYTPQLVK